MSDLTEILGAVSVAHKAGIPDALRTGLRTAREWGIEGDADLVSWLTGCVGVKVAEYAATIRAETLADPADPTPQAPRLPDESE